MPTQSELLPFTIEINIILLNMHMRTAFAKSLSSVKQGMVVLAKILKLPVTPTLPKITYPNLPWPKIMKSKLKCVFKLTAILTGSLFLIRCNIQPL